MKFEIDNYFSNLDKNIEEYKSDLNSLK